MKDITENLPPVVQRAFLSAPYGLALLGTDGCLIVANPSLGRLLGCAAHDLAGQSLESLIHADDRPTLNFLLHELREAHRDHIRLELRALHCDGHPFWVRLICAPIRDEAGKILPYTLLQVEEYTQQKAFEEAFWEQILRNEMILQMASDGFCILSLDGHIREVNASFVAITGYPPEELADRLIHDLVMPADLAALDIHLAAVAEGGSARFETRCRRRDGRTAVLAASLNRIDLVSESLLFLSVRDVTEERAAQVALGESEQKSRAIVEHTHDGIRLVDEQGRLIEWNAGMERISGLSREQVLGRPIWEVLDELTPATMRTPQTRERLQGLTRQMLADGDVSFVRGPIRLQRPDGTIREVLPSMFPVKTDKGYMIGAIVHDITEHQQAQRELQESRRMLQLILDSIPTRVFWKDRNLRYLGCNIAFARDAGLESPAQIVGKTDADMIWREQAEVYTRDDQHVIETGEPLFGIEEPQSRADGAIGWLTTNKVPLRDPDGTIVGVLGTYEDITERKQAEQALRESEQRYRGLFEDLPIALIEADFSGVRAALEAYRAAGVTDFREYFYNYPGEVIACARQLQLLALNRALLDLFETDDPDRLRAHIKRALQEEQFEDFRLLLVALAERQHHVQAEMMVQTVRGNQRYASVQVTIAPGYEDSWSRVIVSMLDVTDRLEAEIALRESEARYKRLFEDVPISLWEEDYSSAKPLIDQLKANGVEDFIAYFDAHPDVLARCVQGIRVVDVNRQTLELYGRESKAPLLDSLGNILPASDWGNLKYELNALAHGQHRMMFESQQMIRGQKRYIIVNLSVAPGYENTWGRILISITDISELKRTEAAEHEQRTLAEALRDTAAALASSLDPETVLDRILDNVGRVVPHDAANFALIEGDHVRIHNWRGYDPALEAEIAAMRIPLETPSFHHMLLTGQPFRIADLTQVGPEQWADWPANRWAKSYAGVPIRTHGQVIGFLNLDSSQAGFFTDEHVERLQAFADQAAIAIENAQLYDEIRRHAADLQARVEARTMELEHERAQLQAILDAMGEGVVYSDNGTVLYVNNRFTEMLGYQAAEVRGHIDHLLDTLMVFEGRDDRRLWLARVIQALRQRGIWHGDVRLRRKNGSEFEASLTATLVGAVESMPLSVVTVVRDVSQERALQAQKDRFIANASHELRTPIANLKTRLYLLRRQPHKKDDHLQVLDYVADQMSDLVEELLDISRFDRGAIRLERQPVALQALVEKVVDVQQPTAAQQGLTLTTRLPEAPLIASIDSKRITQVITNLVVNAMNYTPAGGAITVSVAREEDSAVIRVQDTGIGIPAEALPHIFEPFFRVSEEVARGTGLGLTISREIVDLHGGTLTVESEVGRGSTFTVRLPLERTKQDANDPPEQ
ncbi:MAG: PAS domain S-box protein [Anaerolineae bacterium]|nr:PAS domain S-box protein [Anaerolineae bacterium]